MQKAVFGKERFRQRQVAPCSMLHAPCSMLHAPCFLRVGSVVKKNIQNGK
jgi:hypothetical protein